MKKTTLVALLTGTLAFAGCNPSIKTDIITYHEVSILQEIESGKELKIKIITSNKKYPDQRQEEIREKAEDFINGGEHNILTTETSYSDAYLAEFKIEYTDTNNKNNKIQVMFLHSGERYWDEKQKEVEPWLEEIVNNPQNDIKDVNKIMSEGRLVAAEVYFIKKKKH